MLQWGSSGLQSQGVKSMPSTRRCPGDTRSTRSARIARVVFPLAISSSAELSWSIVSGAMPVFSKNRPFCSCIQLPERSSTSPSPTAADSPCTA